MATVKSFIDLEIWKLSNELEREIYLQITKDTLSKDFELRNQMSRYASQLQ